MTRKFLACLLLLALTGVAAAEGLFETVVRASGETKEAALANALDEAIRKNLGALLSGSEELSGDRLRERLVQFSRGTATRYEILESVQDENGFLLTVKVTVNPQAVRTAARTIREGGGGGVELRKTPLLDKGQDALHAFFHSLNFADFLTVRLEERRLDLRKGVLNATVLLSLNPERFQKDFAGPLARILDTLSTPAELTGELAEEYKLPADRQAATFYLLGPNFSFRAWTLPAAFLDAARRGARLGEFGRGLLRTHRRAWLHFSLKDTEGVELERLPVPLNLSNVLLFSSRRQETGNPWFFSGIEKREERYALSIIGAPFFGAVSGRNYVFFGDYRQPFELHLPQALLARISDAAVSLELER